MSNERANSKEKHAHRNIFLLHACSADHTGDASRQAPWRGVHLKRCALVIIILYNNSFSNNSCWATFSPRVQQAVRAQPSTLTCRGDNSIRNGKSIKFSHFKTFLFINILSGTLRCAEHFLVLVKLPVIPPLVSRGHCDTLNTHFPMTEGLSLQAFVSSSPPKKGQNINTSSQSLSLVMM